MTHLTMTPDTGHSVRITEERHGEAVMYSCKIDGTSIQEREHAHAVELVERHIIIDFLDMQYTVDLPPIPDGWSVRVEQLSKRPIGESFVIIAAAEGHEDVFEVATPAVLNKTAHPSCGNVMKKSTLIARDGAACQRPRGHDGMHMATGVADTYGAAWWDERPSKGMSGSLHGRLLPCPDCGILSAVTPDSEVHCSLCAFWHEQRLFAGGIVVDGSHYRVGGSGGYGGREFKFQRASGSIGEWGDTVTTNKLWHQGEVPAHFRPWFPDNARFVS